MFKVLIVDQDFGFNRSLAQSLTDLGCEVRSVDNSFQARSLIKIDFFDLLIVECFLPDGEGTALVQEMMDFQGKDCQVMLLGSRRASDEFVYQSLKTTKASRFFQKPVAVQKISDLVSQLIQPRKEKLSDFANFITTANSPRFELLHSFRAKEQMLGLELPLVIAQMLRTAEFNCVELFQQNELVLEMQFVNGRIHRIETPMITRREFLPVILGDLALPIDIEELRKNTSIEVLDSEKDLQNLLQLGRIAKHDYNEILQLEALNRVSRFVRAEEFDLRFVKKNVGEANCWFTTAQSISWIGEMVMREVPGEWAREQMCFSDQLKIYWKDHFHFLDEARAQMYMCGAQKIFSMIEQREVLKKIKQSLDFDEIIVYQGFYYLACIGAIWFDAPDEKQLFRDHGDLIERGLVGASLHFGEEKYQNEEKQNLIRRNVLDLLSANCYHKAKDLFYQNLSSFVHHPFGVLAKNWLQLGSNLEMTKTQLAEAEAELKAVNFALKYDPSYQYAMALLAHRKALPGEVKRRINASSGLAKSAKLLLGSKFIRADELFKQTKKVLAAQGKSKSKKSESLFAFISKFVSSTTATPSP